MSRDNTVAVTNELMVRELAARGIVRDPRVEDALRRVPREAFLPEDVRGQAFLDSPLPIGEGQTISAPHMVALMAQALDVRPGMRVLEVGGGSGYHAAVLARLCAPGGSVVTVERHETLAQQARRNLTRLDGPSRVEVVIADGSEGVRERAPFDRISVAAAAPSIPPPLLEQLAPGGVLVIPVGSLNEQDLLRVTKQGGDAPDVRHLGPVRFVPLIGAHGFSA